MKKIDIQAELTLNTTITCEVSDETYEAIVEQGELFNNGVGDGIDMQLYDALYATPDDGGSLKYEVFDHDSTNRIAENYGL